MTRSAVVVAFACGTAVLSAQAPAQQSATPRFEVASVKPAPDSVTRSTFRPDPTHFRGYFTVAGAVAFAYRLEDSRIVEAPQWATDQRYEINATTPPRKPGDIQAMMRHLLEERFALKVHREQRPLAVYVLLVARSDGRLGPRLQRVERDCTASASNSSRCSASYGAGNYRSSGGQWGVFVAALDTGITGRPVVDKTGLSGQVDITLEWNPESTRAPERVSSAPSAAELEAPPGLFTALREQLGLKLESGTAPVDVLVIDSVDRPTPD
jgi:uncharacterized protein (TIGR03435 family)